MYNIIKNKLRQETGASITFALLLFLICAVVCSVVLTAATAASGRMSKTAEYDARYYAVTSAAALMKEQLDGQTVSIVKVTTGTVTTAYEDGIAGTPADNDDAAVKTYLAAGRTVSEIRDTDLTEKSQIDGEGTNATEAAALRSASMLNDAAYFCCFAAADAQPAVRTLQLSSSVTSESGDPLAAVIGESVDPAGNITLVISNEGEEGKKYTVRLTFAADRQTDTGTRSVDGPRENIREAGGKVTYDVTTTVTKTEVISLTWQLGGMETVTE